MNTECLYVLYEGDVESAKKVCVELSNEAKELNHELYPHIIGEAIKDFDVADDYAGEYGSFTVRKGQIVVFAYGKGHSMFELRPDGVRLGFPYALNREYFPDRTGELIKDLLKYDDETGEFVEI